MPYAAAVPAVIGAVGAIGSVLSGNRGRRKEARRAEAFSASQSATSHQRQVADLRAAGLNPILSGMGGSGAATSAGVMAQQDDAIGPGIEAGRSIYISSLEAKNLKETNTQIRMNSAKIAAETKLVEANTSITTAQLPKHQSQAEVWTQILRSLKGIDQHLIQPLIKRLNAPSTSKALSDAIQDAKNMVQRTKEYPSKIIQRAKQKLTNPPKGIEIDEDSNFSYN